MTTVLLIIVSYLIGMVPNQFLYKKIVPLKKLQYVRSDFITAIDTMKHIKEPAFFLTIGTDIIKGLVLGYLGMVFSETGTLALILLLVAIIARNFNPFIGIRNGHGMAILFGGLIMYSPVLLLLMILYTVIIGVAANDLDMAFILSVVLLPVSMAFFSDPLGAVIVSLLITTMVITHQLMYTKEAAKRTRYEDSKHKNPYL